MSAWKRMIREHKYRSKEREEGERYEVTGSYGLAMGISSYGLLAMGVHNAYTVMV